MNPFRRKAPSLNTQAEPTFRRTWSFELLDLAITFNRRTAELRLRLLDIESDIEQLHHGRRSRRVA